MVALTGGWLNTLNRNSFARLHPLSGVFVWKKLHAHTLCFYLVKICNCNCHENLADAVSAFLVLSFCRLRSCLLSWLGCCVLFPAFVFSGLRSSLPVSEMMCPRSCLPPCLPAGLGCCVRLFGLFPSPASKSAVAFVSGRWRTCLVETDVFFVPANFRRLVTLLQMTPKDAHWLGHEVLANHVSNGIQIEPNSGSCLSAYAVQKVGQFYSWFILRHRRQMPMHDYPYFLQWERPPISGECRPFDDRGAKGQGLYQSVITACFRAAGVYPTDPRNLHDLRGRMYYPNAPIDELTEVLHPPDDAHCSWQGPSLDDTMEHFMFAGVNYLFLPCRFQQKIWAADYPVVFHPHLCTNCTSRIKEKETFLRQKALHRLLTRPNYISQCCKGYRPGYDQRFARVKENVWLVLVNSSAAYIVWMYAGMFEKIDNFSSSMDSISICGTHESHEHLRSQTSASQRRHRCVMAVPKLYKKGTQWWNDEIIWRAFWSST